MRPLPGSCAGSGYMPPLEGAEKLNYLQGRRLVQIWFTGALGKLSMSPCDDCGGVLNSPSPQ